MYFKISAIIDIFFAEKFILEIYSNDGIKETTTKYWKQDFE